MNILIGTIGVILLLVLAWVFMHVHIVRTYAAKHGRPMSMGAAAGKVMRDMKRVFLEGKKPEMLFPVNRTSAPGQAGNPVARGIPSAVGHGPGKRPAKRAKQRKRS